MAFAAGRQALVALDQQDAGVADLAVARLVEIEALHRLLFIFPGGGEPGAARLGAADAATVGGAVDARLVKVKHGQRFGIFFDKFYYGCDCYSLILFSSNICLEFSVFLFFFLCLCVFDADLNFVFFFFCNFLNEKKSV